LDKYNKNHKKNTDKRLKNSGGEDED